VKRFGFSVGLALLGALPGVSGAAPPAAPPAAAAACPADPALGRLVAASHLVLVGRMDVPRQALTDGQERYVDIPATVSATIKGDEAGPATIRFFTRDDGYHPSNADVLALADAPAILFLTRVDEGRGALYFAGHSPAALQGASQPNLAAARGEAARQARLLRSWRADPGLPHYREVRRLIARLGRVEGDEQQRVFDRLEALGPDSVPAIVAQMDDRRPLRWRQISLVNRAPNAWEARRHYGPELVVDGLDAVLGQITGASFGQIHNGGSDRERRAAVAGWRVYAADLHCGP
jgi:hypothetical protein